MENPNPINLQTPAEVRALGWAAEARDDDGHVMSCHAPFTDDRDLGEYVRHSMEQGWIVTIWPHSDLAPKT